MIQRAKEILELEIETLRNLPLNEEILKQVIDLILNCQGKIVFSGIGKAGLVAKKIAASMSSTGTPSFFINPGESTHGDLGALDDRDIIIAISNSGKTNEILLMLNLCKKGFACPIIGICSSANSEMGKLCDLVLEIGQIQEACPFNLVPTSSTTAMMVLGDILTILVMEAKGFTLEEYSFRHHAGYISELIKQRLV